MGQTAADTQREIMALRQEITDAASELDRRVAHLLDVKARLQDARAFAIRTVEERPETAAKAAGGVALGVALLGVRAVLGSRKKKSTAARLAAMRDAGQEEAARRIEEAVAQARELLASSGARVALLASDSSATPSEPSMIKKLIWTILTAGSLALAGLIARKLSTSLWQAVMHEEPPTASA